MYAQAQLLLRRICRRQAEEYGPVSFGDRGCYTIVTLENSKIGEDRHECDTNCPCGDNSHIANNVSEPDHPEIQM
jgi:hypothetical protein